MKIGILGSGGVGVSLGNAFLATGHDVMLSGREPNERTNAWAAEHLGARTGAFADAAAWGEVVVLATAWSGTGNALRLAGPERLAGKVLVDVTNPLAPAPPMRLAVGTDDSGGETVARWVPGAKVVKAFNTVGHELMFRPRFAGGIPDMFYAGDDDDAKGLVKVFIEDFGWNPVDAGPISASRLLEPLALLWITLGIRGHGWTHAFHLLRGGSGAPSARVGTA